MKKTKKTGIERARELAPNGYPDADLARLTFGNNRNNTAAFTESGAVVPPESPENEFGIGNQERAEVALSGIVGFTKACATDDCDAVADFLCDLMHLLDRMPTYYGTMSDNLRRAAGNYAAEIGDGSGHESNPLLAAFKGLLAMGLKQSDVLEALHDADPNVREHDGTIEAARSNYAGDDVEIDDKPLLSVADKGVWVSAWVWVEIEDEDHACESCGETAQDGSGTCITCGAEG